jgi:hypothetical protein
MLKKLDISEKLKKFSDGVEKKGPILKPKRPSEIKEDKAGAEPEMEPPASTPPETSKGPKRVLAKTPADTYHSMADFLITEEDIKKSKTKYQGVEEDKLEQVLEVGNSKPVDIKWTVTKDPFAEEFSMLTRELRLVKTSPPIYASEFENARVVSSHVGLYTLTMGSFKLDLEKLVEAFTGVLRSKGLI